jgi:hypothetical protein
MEELEADSSSSTPTKSTEIWNLSSVKKLVENLMIYQYLHSFQVPEGVLNLYYQICVFFFSGWGQLSLIPSL